MNMFILISFAIYSAYYIINNNPLFAQFWELFECTTMGKLIRCSFCFSFWVGLPISIVMALCISPIYAFISPFCAVVNIIIDKIIKL